MGKSGRFHAALILAVLATARLAAAAPIRVARDGTDSATCGVDSNPACATIAQAVSNAADGDAIFVGPGSYPGTTVGKPVSLWSSAGTGAARIVSTMTLSADGILFGTSGKGFVVDVGTGTAIVASGNLVTVRGNLVSNCTIGVDATGNGDIVRDNSFGYCETGVRIAGDAGLVRANRFGYASTAAVALAATSTAAQVSDNRIVDPSVAAVAISGADHVVRRNLVQGAQEGFTSSGTPSNVQLVENLVVSSWGPAFHLTGGSGWILTGNAAVSSKILGFYLTADSAMTLSNNVAIGNGNYGILITGAGSHVLTGNSAIDNGDSGITIAGAASGVTVTGGNVHGNGSNCGVRLASPNPVSVTKMYWGAAGGPGSDPADEICDNVAGVEVSNSAVEANRIKVPPLK